MDFLADGCRNRCLTMGQFWLLAVVIAGALPVVRSQHEHQLSIVVLVEQPYPNNSNSYINDTTEVEVVNTDTTLNVTTLTVDITNLNVFQIYALVCQHVRTGAILFLAAVSSCDTLSHISSALTEIGVPLINLEDMCSDANDFQRIMRYMPPRRTMEDSLKDVLQATGWQHFILLHDTHFGGADIDLSGPMMINNISAWAFNLDDVGIGAALSTVHDNHAVITNIVVACSLQCMKEILHTALLLDNGGSYQGLFTYRVKFLLITDYEQMVHLEDYVHDLDHVSAVVPMRRQYTTADAVQDIRDILFQRIMMYDETQTAPPSGESQCGSYSPIADFTKDVLQSYFHEASCHNCTQYEVHAAIYTPSNGSEFPQEFRREFQLVGEWTPEQYIEHAPVLPNLQYGFNKRHFRVGTNLWGPFVHVSENSTDGYDGLCIQLLRELSRDLNFTFDLSMPADGGWGGDVNGNWTGLVGILQTKEVDMVVAPIASNGDREKVMDFTEAFYLEYTAVLVRYTDRNADKWRLYLQPFRWESWLCFLMAIPVGAFFVWMVTRLTPYYPCHGEKACAEAYKGLGTFYNALLSTFGAFFQQGSIWLPQAQSVRFIVGFWWMYCIVVMATYSGNLIAYLTVTKTELPFDSLEEMAANDDFKFGIMGGTITQHMLSKARSGIEKELWDKIEDWYKDDKSITSTNQTEQIKRVLDEQYAYINDRTGFELEMSTTCDVGVVNELFLPSEYSVGLQNNSYFLPALSQDVTKIKESGLINKLKAEYWPRQSFCSTGMQTEAKAVSLNDVQGAYYAMAILLGLAFVSLATEKIIQFSRGRKSKVRKKPAGHSGGYLDDVRNGNTAHKYSDYFADFSHSETHEMRSVRNQSVKHRGNGFAGQSNGYTSGDYSNGSVLSHENIWTYEPIRGDAYTYNNITKNVV